MPRSPALRTLLREDIRPVADDLMVIAEEFAAFSDVNRRVDLLWLSRTGDLVVVELKRTHDGGHMEMQGAALRGLRQHHDVRAGRRRARALL